MMGGAKIKVKAKVRRNTNRCCCGGNNEDRLGGLDRRPKDKISMDLMHELGGVWATTDLGKKLCPVTPVSIPTALAHGMIFIK